MISPPLVLMLKVAMLHFISSVVRHTPDGTVTLAYITYHAHIQKEHTIYHHCSIIKLGSLVESEIADFSSYFHSSFSQISSPCRAIFNPLLT